MYSSEVEQIPGIHDALKWFPNTPPYKYFNNLLTKGDLSMMSENNNAGNTMTIGTANKALHRNTFHLDVLYMKNYVLFPKWVFAIQSTFSSP